MIASLIRQLLTALLITAVVLQCRGSSYLGRVLVVIAITFAGGLLCHVPNWNWWAFPTAWTLEHMIDLIVAGLLAGLAIAAVAKQSRT